MYPKDSRATGPIAAPTCADCGGQTRHADTCPARSDLLNLLDTDQARLAVSPIGAFQRPLHRVERATLADAGYHVPRNEPGRWSVTVTGSEDTVTRTIRRDGHAVAEMIDEPVGAQ